jgi:hypothetical protein
MLKSNMFTAEQKIRASKKKFSEADEFNHERNQVSKAQKQAASQETTGLLDQQ